MKYLVDSNIIIYHAFMHPTLAYIFGLSRFSELSINSKYYVASRVNNQFGIRYVPRTG